MEDTALVVRPVVDLSKLDKRQLKVWEKHQDKDRMVDLLKAGANFTHAVLENEVVLLLTGFAVGNWMLQRGEHPPEGEDPHFPFLESGDATLLGAGLIAIGLAKAGVIENIGEAVGAIRGN